MWSMVSYFEVSKVRKPCRAVVMVKVLTSDENPQRGLYCRGNLVNVHFNQ